MNRRNFLTAAAAVAAATLDPDRLYAATAPADWTLGVADVEADIAPRALTRIHGRAPEGLSGDLFRNGPARFRRPGGSVGHWFDGDGLVRRFTLRDGEASLAARFVDTAKRRADAAAGAVVTAGFGTPAGPGSSIRVADDVNSANISVLTAGEELWALWESGSPIAMDPETLATRGVRTLRPDLAGMPFLAHPRYEPDGTIWNLGLARDKAIVWKLAADGALLSASVIPIPRASYVHDFTATAGSLVIVLQPWIQERLVAPLTAGFAWRPEQGAQILVVDKADLGRRRVYETESFFAFHMADAWEESDGTIRFDLCADADPAFAVEGGEALVAGRRPATRTRPDLRMFALRPDGRVSVERCGLVAEFPKADPRFAGHRRALTACVSDGRGDHPFFRSLAVRDWRRDRVDRFDFGPRHIVEEAVLVPRPGGSAEFDGWLVGATINLDARASELHVFDARRVAAGPLCSWRADLALPISLHGVFRSA